MDHPSDNTDRQRHLVGHINAPDGQVLVIGGSQTGAIDMRTIYATEAITPRARKDRERMLARVRRIWIDGYLVDSLHGTAQLSPDLAIRNGDTDQPVDVGGALPDLVDAAPFSPTTIGMLFDHFDRELLLVGEPGAGKTIVLLQLARALIQRAEQDEALPIPVVFPLASWAKVRCPVDEWLVNELSERYDVPRKIAATWVGDDRILPLLDGLDEVAVTHRPACVAAINAFKMSRKRELLGLVVTSRTADYDAIGRDIQVSGVVLVRPLRPEQVDSFVAAAGDELSGLSSALRDDSTLRELATSPLMLMTMSLAYHGLPASALAASGSVEERRANLFGAYIARMLARRALNTRYSDQATAHWLSWLAAELSRQSLTVFHVEHLQPEWLAGRRLRFEYWAVERLAGGVVGAVAIGGVWSSIDLSTAAAGLVCGALVGMLFGGSSGRSPTGRRRQLGNAVQGWLCVGLLTGLFMTITRMDGLATFVLGPILSIFGALAGAMAGGITLGPRRVRIVETIRWSTRTAISSAFGGLIIGSLVAVPLWLVADAFSGLFFGFGAEDPYWIGLLAVASGVAFGVLFGVSGGLSGREVEVRIAPNQGIHRSMQLALVVGGSVALLIGVSAGLAWWLVTGDIASGAALVPLLAVPVAAVYALAFGGYACMSHGALRVVLRRSNLLPLDVVDFLEYARERILLRRVGGGYMFTHRLLQEYFANHSVIPDQIVGGQLKMPPETDVAAAPVVQILTAAGGVVDSLDAQRGRVVVIGGNQSGTIDSRAMYATSEPDPRELRDRERMLGRVRRMWIDGRLHQYAEQTLDGFSLRERPDAVPDRWSALVQQPDRPAPSAWPGRAIGEAFDKFDGDLLILGEAGTGKTHVLLELCRLLLERAERDEGLPVPVVFMLSGWGAAYEHVPFANWLVNALTSDYNVPLVIARRWLDDDRILPLLDGFDGVAPSARQACVRAINAFRRASSRDLSGMVVTARTSDYLSMGVRLEMRGALEVTSHVLG